MSLRCTMMVLTTFLMVVMGMSYVWQARARRTLHHQRLRSSSRLHEPSRTTVSCIHSVRYIIGYTKNIVVFAGFIVRPLWCTVNLALDDIVVAGRVVRICQCLI